MGYAEIKVYNIRLSLGLKRFMHAIQKGEELLSNGSVPKETKLTGRNGTRNIRVWACVPSSNAPP